MKKIALLLIPLLLSACAFKKGPEKFTETYYGYFDTVITLTGYAPDKSRFDEAAGLAKKEFARLHEIYDIYEPHEGVNGAYMLNHSKGETVRIEAELMDLLHLSKSRYEAGKGRTNVAMGAVLELWHDARERGVPPSEEALKSANDHTAIADLELNPDALTARLIDPDLRIDLGAVAKGYATEKVAEMIREIMPMFLIDAGGNIRVGDPPPGKDAYSIGVTDPFAAISGKPDIITTIPLVNAAAVTSGGYQRVFRHDGQDYHHLIDPGTLYPGEYMAQITVISEDSGLADFLSTAAFLLPYEASRALVMEMGADAIWILKDGTIQR